MIRLGIILGLAAAIAGAAGWVLYDIRSRAWAECVSAERLQRAERQVAALTEAAAERERLLRDRSEKLAMLDARLELIEREKGELRNAQPSNTTVVFPVGDRWLSGVRQ